MGINFRSDAFALALSPLERGPWIEAEWRDGHGDEALRLLEYRLVSIPIQSVTGTRRWSYYSTVLRCTVHVLRVGYVLRT